MKSMMNETLYSVVVNDEEQYSIWPGFKPVPPGWRTVGEPAAREECLGRIEALWTDLRPLILRHRLAASGAPDA